MGIAVRYDETTTSKIVLTAEQARAPLADHGHTAPADASNADLAAALTAEVRAAASDLPAALEPLVDVATEIADRQWTITGA